MSTWNIYGMGGELIAEYPANGATNMPQMEYGYRGGELLIEGGCDVVRWKVSDHLGSTRMSVDRTGALANVKRTDYLPFGEEIGAGVGIRTAAQGYSQGDCWKQKFTGYEKDTETGLDYAQARYYANVQGRFTGVDGLLGSGEIINPQTWNRYSYSLNNPLLLTDPSGLYVFGDNVEEEQRAVFRASLTKAQEALKGYKEGSKEYNQIKRSLDFYGKEGVKNGVTVMAGNLIGAGAQTQVVGARGAITKDNPNGQQIRVTIDKSYFKKDTEIEDRALEVLHEGTHGADGSEWVTSGFSEGSNPTTYQTEMNAFMTQGLAARVLTPNKDSWYPGSISVPGRAYGLPTKYYIWNSGWKAADLSVVQANISKEANGLIGSPTRQGGYGLTAESKAKAFTKGATKLDR